MAHGQFKFILFSPTLNFFLLRIPYLSEWYTKALSGPNQKLVMSSLTLPFLSTDSQSPFIFY